MSFIKISEQSSLYDNLEQKSVHELLVDMNTEDKKVALAVEKAIPQIEALVEKIIPRMEKGGRVFYMGAGTSGRLGVLDASELPPTFGVPPTMVYGLIAGGDTAQCRRECRRRYTTRMGRTRGTWHIRRRYCHWYCCLRHYPLRHRSFERSPCTRHTDRLHHEQS